MVSCYCWRPIAPCHSYADIPRPFDRVRYYIIGGQADLCGKKLDRLTVEGEELVGGSRKKGEGLIVDGI